MSEFFIEFFGILIALGLVMRLTTRMTNLEIVQLLISGGAMGLAVAVFMAGMWADLYLP